MCAARLSAGRYSHASSRLVLTGALGNPVFVADMATRLCARDAGSVTGATWDINGGLYVR